LALFNHSFVIVYFMVVIRLSRVGKSSQPSYRVIISDKRKDPWGTALEVVGTYNPSVKPKAVLFNKERITHWISVGAQPSPTVYNLLVDAGVLAGKKRRASKNVPKPAAPAEAAHATTPAPAAA